MSLPNPAELSRQMASDLQAHLADPSKPIDGGQYKYTTHYLEYQNSDPIVNALNGSILTTDDSKVKVIFVPTYLNKADGIFNKDYYELLVGMDITVFPSYYEPWGYTPLESVAFSVPTITTSAGRAGPEASTRARAPISASQRSEPSRAGCS